MALSINLADLPSRAARAAAVGTTGGIRRFATNGTQQVKNSDGNIVDAIWSAITRFGGWLIRGLWTAIGGALTFTFSALWAAATSAVRFIYNFNWNITDAALDASIQSTWTAIGSSLGGTLGNAAGWLACGVLPGTIMFAFNEALALYVLKNVGEEALDELAGNVAVLVRQTFAAVGKTAFSYLYKTTRKLAKTTFSGYINGLMSQDPPGIDPVEGQKILDGLNNPNPKPWSFALAVEEKIESIPNQFVQNFVEEFLEEASEACIEAGYVVANSADSYFAANKLASANLLGKTHTVEIEFNRNPETTTAPA